MTFVNNIGLNVSNLRSIRGFGDFLSTIIKTKIDTILVTKTGFELMAHLLYPRGFFRALQV